VPAIEQALHEGILLCRILVAQRAGKLARNGVNATVVFVNNTGREQTTPLLLDDSSANGRVTFDVAVPPGESSRTYFTQLPASAARWSEFNPVTHTATAWLG